MKISEEQIQKLYLFTSQHFVKHYDLQTELVDHLANGIEKEIAVNPNLTFKEALRKEFKKFGVCGFNDVIVDRRKAMAKRYRKYIFRFYKEYFRLPKILMLLVLTLVLFLMLQFVNPGNKFLALTIFAFVIGGVFLRYNLRNQNKYQSKNGTLQKRWMMEEMISNIGDGGSMAIFPMYLFNALIGGNHQLENIYLESLVSGKTF